MKKYYASLFAVLVLWQSVGAQKESLIRPAALGIGFTLTDFTTASRLRSSSLGSVLNNKQWGKLKDMSPGLAVSYFKGLTPHIDFAGTLHGSFLNYPFANRLPFAGDNLLLEADASAQFKMVTEKYWVIPYLSLGVGAQKYKNYYGAFMPAGAGIRLNFFDEASLFINSQYRIPVTVENSSHHFFHSIGVTGIIGKKKEPEVKQEVIPPPPAPVDTDKDGINDDKDKCPTVAGVEKYEGCPVPDTDKDGINDESDKCITEPGLARYQGCPVPDTDKDGINDEEDKCITVPGVARYQGCPVPDGDGDGVNDEEDKCPTIAGVSDQQGCPEVKPDIINQVGNVEKRVYFETGSAKLLGKSFKPLNEVVKIMKDNPDLKLAINGHADITGTTERNQVLSEERAASVKAYLVSKGVDESRLTTAGFGVDQPAADNNTVSGRAKNRRVELKISY